MTLFDIFLLGLALSVDAFVVSFSYGLVLKPHRMSNGLKLGAATGFFQFLMPVIGWHLTGFVYSALELYAKWVVFCVFIFLGTKFLISAFKNHNEENNINCISLLCLLWLAFVTSIDALGAGISIRFTGISIIKPAVIIGIITFILSFFGFWIANIFKRLPVKYLEIIAALLLVYLAFKAVI